MKKWIAVIGMALAITAGTSTGFADEHGAHAVRPGERTFHVLKALPAEADAYQGPAAGLVRRGVPALYGKEEWAAVVLTHELHQHVGVMTTIGAKMAVRARELLEAPPRVVKVVSETGPNPPFSCAVDGLQAGLASTYAQQLIEAPAVDEPRLAATFTYEGRTLRLALRPEFQKQVRACIRTAIKDHGNLTHEYFEEIEAFSYVVWETFDRHEIFDEEFLKTGKD
jgi:formylmethanofuran dehydrogenase subunit E